MYEMLFWGIRSGIKKISLSHNWQVCFVVCFRTAARPCATHKAHGHISLMILVEWMMTRLPSGATVSILTAGNVFIRLWVLHWKHLWDQLWYSVSAPTAGLGPARRLHCSSTGATRSTSTTRFTPLHRRDHYEIFLWPSQAIVQHYLFLLSSSIGLFALICIRSIYTSEIAPWLFKAQHN